MAEDAAELALEGLTKVIDRFFEPGYDKARDMNKKRKEKKTRSGKEDGYQSDGRSARRSGVFDDDASSSRRSLDQDLRKTRTYDDNRDFHAQRDRYDAAPASRDLRKSKTFDVNESHRQDEAVSMSTPPRRHQSLRHSNAGTRSHDSSRRSSSVADHRDSSRRHGHSRHGSSHTRHEDSHSRHERKSSDDRRSRYEDNHARHRDSIDSDRGRVPSEVKSFDRFSDTQPIERLRTSERPFPGSERYIPPAYQGYKH